VEDGFDLAIRADGLPDSSLISRRLGSASWSACASPGYLARRGEPLRPADLAAHNCLIYAPHWGDGKWCFTDGDCEHGVHVSGSMRSNDPEVLRTAAISGQGLTLLPDISAAADLAAGRLVRVLRGYSVEQAAVYAVFPSGRQIPQKVRSFVDFAVGRFSALRPPGSQPRQAEFDTLASNFAQLALVDAQPGGAWPWAATAPCNAPHPSRQHPCRTLGSPA
jgi:DNA-binding transcriptional LysR family regulator